MSSPEVRFAGEVLKLLVQVAWSDDDIALEESSAILGAARDVPMSAEDIAALERALRGEAPPPAPDLGILRANAERAIAAARDFIAIDGKIAPDERRILEIIKELLEPPP